MKKSGLLTIPGNTNRYRRLLNKFNGDGTDISIRHEWGANDIYSVAQHSHGDKYLTINLVSSESIAENAEWVRIEKIKLQTLYAGYNDQSTEVTLSGTWSATTNVDSYWGGRIAFSNTATDYIEFVTDDGVTSIGINLRYGISGGGVVLVTIDGDNTKANLLSTAQDLVTAGTLADTVLVANGGTLNPTDRVIDEHGLLSSPLIASLDAGVHTVRMTVTGYKSATSANNTVYFHAFYAYGSGLYDLETPLYYFYSDVGVATAEDYFTGEISWGFTPTGGSVVEWVGHVGSLKITTPLPVLTIDGVETTLTKGQSDLCTSLKFVENLTIRHIETGATDLGTVQMTFEFHNVNGFYVSHKTIWGSEGTLGICYPCMMTLDTIFDRSKTIDTVVASLDDDDSSRKNNTKTAALWAWDYDGYVGAIMYMPSLGLNVNNWSENDYDYQLAMHDDNAGIWNKIRAIRRVGGSYTSGLTWESRTNYRLKYFSGGANNELATY